MNKDQMDIEYKREVVRQLRRIADALEKLANSTAPLIEEKET